MDSTEQNKHNYSRRKFIQTGTLTGMGVLFGSSIFANSEPMVDFLKKYTVTLGAITYSFRSLPDSVDNLIKYCNEAGIKAIELMGDTVENFAGRPAPQNGAQRAASNIAIRNWRESVAMDKFIEFRKLMDQASISVYAFKPSALEKDNSDGEVAYALKVGKILGAKSLTVELPRDAAQSLRLGKLAEAHQMFIGYHAHTQATDTAWDVALAQSPGNSMNLDCGHYIAAGGNNTKESLLALIEKKHDRITSMHLKDRLSKDHGGANVVWGKGDTPITEIITLVKKKKYPIPMSIELEYDIPKNSDAVKEVKRCVDFAKEYV